MIDPKQIFHFENKTKGEEITATWLVPEKLPYFEGHFPGDPILPGVAILDMIEVLLDGQFKFIKAAKFTEIVRPLDILSVTAKFDSLKKNWNVSITNQNNLSVCKTTLQLN